MGSSVVQASAKFKGCNDGCATKAWFSFFLRNRSVRCGLARLPLLRICVLDLRFTKKQARVQGVQRQVRTKSVIALCSSALFHSVWSGRGGLVGG